MPLSYFMVMRSTNFTFDFVGETDDVLPREVCPDQVNLKELYDERDRVCKRHVLVH